MNLGGEELEVDNVVLYIADAVRYDYSHHDLEKIGPTYKTIAASHHTPASVSSLLTGLNVPEHGVTSFTKRVPETTPSVFDIPDVDARISSKPELQKVMIRNFLDAGRSSLSELDPPFVWIERGPGGHAPYNQFDYETYRWGEEGASEYLHRLATQLKRLQDDYESAVQQSIDRFRHLINQAQSLEGETLLIYTSDHGELLGEYGLLGHGYTACPEMVTVPTTLVHNSLSAGKKRRLVRNIDILPTVLSALGKSEISREWELSGSSVLGQESVAAGYTHYERSIETPKILPNINRVEKSVWDQTGGHAFIDTSYWEALALYNGMLAKLPQGKLIRKQRSFWESYSMFSPGHRVHGSPEITEVEAKGFIDEIGSRESQSLALSEEARGQLEDLGYVVD